ncbi:MAG: sporulation transcriptional regulator SpoIIID [Oscillospiraceae bacterium]|nr:sporulation transcriptional regulator SpoIIID [Oscillospiraceae bacterium]
MDDTIERRSCDLAVYIIETGVTVRAAAKKFGISKSTVHKDLSQRLPQCNKTLYNQVRKVLEVNKAQRHIRGGMATKAKYLKEKEYRKKSGCQ